jgi:hypothetical protein
MLGNRLYTFSQFILERANRDIGSYYLSKLTQLQDTEVLGKLEELSNSLNDLENRYWYEREGGRAHYALNMKIHAYPDLEKWAAARGEEDLEEVDDEMMYEDWARYMEDTYEMHAEDYKESFSWIKEVGAGGKSGGWLLIYPETTHDNIEDDVSYQIEDYLNYLDDESDLELIKNMLSNPDIKELADMGLVSADDLENGQEAMKSRQSLLNSIDKTIEELTETSEDLAMITGEIENFRKTAETHFYEWASESSL